MTKPEERAADAPIGSGSGLGCPVMRVARASDDLDALVPFYCDGLGLEVLYRFVDHDGFDGMMLGHPAAPYHLEFTHAHGEVVGRAPTKENLLVFYLPDVLIWQRAVDRMTSAGFARVEAANRFWEVCGATFEDPDGYRVILQRAEWKI